MFRGLQGLSARWGELIAAAQAVMGIYQDLTTGSAEQLYDEQNALPLIAASRILDAASQCPSALPDEDRQYLAVVAAVAFAMYGNFPSDFSGSSLGQPQMRQSHPGYVKVLDIP